VANALAVAAAPTAEALMKLRRETGLDSVDLLFMIVRKCPQGSGARQAKIGKVKDAFHRVHEARPSRSEFQTDEKPPLSLRR
jgi:hypothetical protein